MIDVSKLVAVQRLMVELWHTDGISNPYRDLLQLVCEQHKFNFLLWHEEDIARSPDVVRRSDRGRQTGDRRLQPAAQRRHRADRRVLVRRLQDRGIVPPRRRPANTETPGSAIDRLSILACGFITCEEQADRADAPPEHIERARQKLAILTAQQEDLAAALADLCDDLAAGRKRLKIYRQFKMYNDPTLNPYLYAVPQRMAG